MANTILQIKRSTTTAIPTSLEVGELAYSGNGSSNALFIGHPDNATGVIRIAGGKYGYLHSASVGALTANAAVVVDANAFISNTFTSGLFVGSSIASPVANSTAALITSITPKANTTQLGASSGGSNTELATTFAIKTYVDGQVATAGNAAANAYSNAVAQANTLAYDYAANAYANAVADANTTSYNQAANAYSNAVSTANTTSYNQAANAYANAVATANTTAHDYAANAYSNAVSTANTTSYNQAANAYANAVASANTLAHDYAANAYANAIFEANVYAHDYAANAYANAVSTANTTSYNQAANAYSNAVAEANTLAHDYAANAYANAVTTANTTSYNQAANAYSNAVSTANTTSYNQAANAYANAVADANTTSFNQAANAYANAVAYANQAAHDAYTNAVASAAAAGSNGQVQYNNGNNRFTASAGLAFNVDSNTLTVASAFTANATKLTFNGSNVDLVMATVATGDLYAAALSANGNVVLGDGSADHLSVKASVNTNIMPSANVAYALGNNDLRWSEIHAGNVHSAYAKFDYDVEIGGNLVINGNTVTVNVSTLAVTDSLIQMAVNNVGSDLLDIGFYGNYQSGADPHEHAGFYRDHVDGLFKIFDGLQVSPSNTVVNAAAAGYNVGTLQAYLNSGGLTTNSTAVTITGNSSVTVSVTANTLSLTTALAATEGGTGHKSYVAGDLVYASNTTYLSTLAANTEGKILQMNSSGMPVWGGIDGGTF